MSECMKNFYGCLLLLSTVQWLMGCTRKPAALVQVNFPAAYSYSGRSVLSGQTSVTIECLPGRQILSFKKNGQDYVSVLEVPRGGEGYVSLNETDFVRVVVVRDQN